MWEKRREKEKKQEKRLFSGMKISGKIQVLALNPKDKKDTCQNLKFLEEFRIFPKKSLNRNINLLSFIFLSGGSTFLSLGSTFS